MSIINRQLEQLDDFIWKNRMAPGASLWERGLVSTLRFVYVLIRDLAAGQLNLRAMSLVYTTLLSLVPLLAFSFSVMKGLGVHNQLQPLLFDALEYLGPKGHELGERIMGFVDNVRADVLGSIGLVILIYLIISLVQKVESSFNYVWHVQEPRSLAKRFSNYLSVILVAPLLITAAIGITATASNNAFVQQLASIEPFGTMLLILSHLVPYLIVIAAFTFVYVFVPNADVRLGPALVGGLVAGLVWQTAGWVFANFVAGSGKYIAIYSSFAVVLTFMIWLYLNWLILLVGAQVAFYVQNPNFIEKSGGRLTLSSRLRELLAMEIMFLVGKSFTHGEGAWNIQKLADHLEIPGDAVASVTTRLERAGLLLVTDEPLARLVPGLDPAEICLHDIRSAVRRTDPALDYDEWHVPISAEIDRLGAQVDEAAKNCLDGLTLRQLVTGQRKE